MKRSKKLGYLLFYLILMLLFGTLIFTYYKVAPANFNFTGKTYEEIHRFIMTNEYWRLFSFWAAVVLGVISVLGFIIVLFYPCQVDAYVFKDKNSQLRISRKALLGFVTASLEDQTFVNNPKIKINIRRKKIKVQVRGELNNSASNVAEIEQMWADQLTQDLTNLIGLKQKKTVRVNLATSKKSKKSDVAVDGSKKSRVI